MASKKRYPTPPRSKKQPVTVKSFAELAPFFKLKPCVAKTEDAINCNLTVAFFTESNYLPISGRELYRNEDSRWGRTVRVFDPKVPKFMDKPSTWSFTPAHAASFLGL